MLKNLSAKARIGVVALIVLIGIGIVTLVVILASNKDQATEATPIVKDVILFEDADGMLGPTLIETTVMVEQPGLYEKFELMLKLQQTYNNPFDPDEIDLSAVFVSPQGKEWHINGFYNGYNWRVRFAPNEVGNWRYRIVMKDKTGTNYGEEAGFEAVTSARKGWIRVSNQNKRFFEHDNGTSFYGVGVAYPWSVSESRLDIIKASGGNLITYWNGDYDSGGGKNQLESVSSGIGRYDTYKAERVDEIVDLLEAREMKMNFAIWPHDSLTDKLPGWPATWQKNAYSTLGEAKDFYTSEEMWKYQEKLYRYIIARWGHSEAIGTWDLVVEISGTDGWALGDPKAANAWIEKVHRYFKENDPYNHPTNGSRAGNEDDYWAEGYKVLDVSDRENYYGLNAAEYAKDIQMRWPRYEKPLVIGETGNIADVNTYHDAIWTGLSNGLAGIPVWWDITKMNDEMFTQMKAISTFVERISFNEAREPIALASKMIQQQLDKEQPIPYGKSATDWSQPDWAQANLDENGAQYSVKEDGDALATQMRFATGSFSQGAVTTYFNKSDWSYYDQLHIDVYIEQQGSEEIKVRPVLFPNNTWDEGEDISDVKLTSGQWTTLAIPLRNAPEYYWRNASITEADLKLMMGLGLKFYTVASSTSAKPVVVKFKNPRLIADQAPTIEVQESKGWVMKGNSTSYGWLIAGNGTAGGKSANIEGLGPIHATVSWFDPWKGEFIGDTAVESKGDRLTITAPNTSNRDVAFIISRNE